MNFAVISSRLKPLMLPIAMVVGVVFHAYMECVEFLTPYLIFVMLLITFCRVSPKELRVTQFSWLLLGVQLAGAGALYVVLHPFNAVLAQGAFICVFCPTATAAPVITGMLGGSVPRLITFSIVSNLSVALLSPLAFSLMGDGAVISFTDSVIMIAKRVVPLIVAPLLLAFVLQRAAPKVHHTIATRQDWSFYIWAVSLVLVVGRSVSFIMQEPSGEVWTMLCLAFVSGIVCGLQFITGRVLGRRCGDKIAGAQGLGQKNTVLAIWMALTYLEPVSSVAPAAYVAWQNTVNSLQLYFKARR